MLERRRERVPVKRCEPVEPIAKRRADLMDRCKRERALVLDAGGPDDAHRLRGVGATVEESAEPAAELAAKDERATTAVRRRIEQLVKYELLTLATEDLHLRGAYVPFCSSGPRWTPHPASGRAST
jgi:hypothetical protein